jgi:acetyltransferase-like isoleucine patch superfamily enzyme
LKPLIGEFVTVHPRAVLEDDVVICDHVSVGAQPVIYVGFKLQEAGFGVRVGQGSVVHAGAHIVLGMVRDTVIGRECCVGQNSVIGHDVVIGDRVQVMNGVSINGFAEVGTLSVVGCGALVRERVRIGCSTLIGMGSVVTKDVPSNVVAYGSPCHVVRRHDGDIKFLLKRIAWGT